MKLNLLSRKWNHSADILQMFGASLFLFKMQKFKELPIFSNHFFNEDIVNMQLFSVMYYFYIFVHIYYVIIAYFVFVLIFKYIYTQVCALENCKLLVQIG